ncbi:hypothetical protein Tco_0252851 [Tanacetum coccineum]
MTMPMIEMIKEVDDALDDDKKTENDDDEELTELIILVFPISDDEDSDDEDERIKCCRSNDAEKATIQRIRMKKSMIPNDLR